MPLAELREEQAPSEIAALYAALRRATGVPLVNLIYRHLATLPGVLPWVWQSIRPPLEDGRLATARDRLAAALPSLQPARVTEADWRRAGLAPEERRRVAALAEVYDRGNLTNLILLTALRRTLEGVSLPEVTPVAPAPEPPVPTMLAAPPPLPRLDELPEEVAMLVRGLAARHRETGDVVPSLYLHLAYWPGLLARLPEWLSPTLEPAELAAARDVTIRLAEREADALGSVGSPAAEVPGGHGPAVLAAITRFTRELIPGMVPVGLALRRVIDV